MIGMSCKVQLLCKREAFLPEQPIGFAFSGALRGMERFVLPAIVSNPRGSAGLAFLVYITIAGICVVRMSVLIRHALVH